MDRRCSVPAVPGGGPGWASVAGAHAGGGDGPGDRRQRSAALVERIRGAIGELLDGEGARVRALARLRGIVAEGTAREDHRESARLEGHLGAAAGKAPVGRVDVEVTAAIAQRFQLDPPPWALLEGS